MNLGELERLIKDTLAESDAETRYEIRHHGVRVIDSKADYKVAGVGIESRSEVFMGEVTKVKVLVLEIELSFDYDVSYNGPFKESNNG